MWCRSLSNLPALTFFLACIPFTTNGTSFPYVWNVPAENPNFVGREDTLQEIAQFIEAAPTRVVVMSGPQGFGKSQIAKRFIYQNFSNYDVVWWFRANQYLKPQFERFALMVASYLGVILPPSLESIGHEHLIMLIKEELRRKNVKCLIIFDDAQTYADIEPYILFSHDKTIHTFITTKNGNFSANMLRVEPFKREESLRYINLFLPHESNTLKNQLAERFGDCPAAIAISVDYIKSCPGLTIEQYLCKHDSQKITLLPPVVEAQKLGGSVDGYDKDLLAAIQMNIKELRHHSEEAFLFLNFLALLHRDEIPLSLIEKWVMARGMKTPIMTLVHLINQYSFVEVHDPKTNKEAYLTMQDLIQEIISSQVPISEKKNHIDDIAKMLKESFVGRSDEVAEAILKDNKPLLNALKVSEEANRIDHHSPELTFIRIRALGVLMGLLRDYDKAKAVLECLHKDLTKKVPFSQEDKMLYNINWALFTGIYEINYEKAATLTKEALALSEALETGPEEQIRIIANLIQYNALSGLEKECFPLIEKGEKLLPLSQSVPYNILFIYATTLVLNDQGQTQKTIELLRQHQNLWNKQSFYPVMRFYTLNQFAEALIKEGKTKEASNLLDLSNKYGKEFYGGVQENGFFGNWHVLKAMCLCAEPESIDKATVLFKIALQFQETYFKGAEKHRNQAFAHLQFGKLFQEQGQFDQAKAQYLKSEAIFEKLLKNKKVDDMSELYKRLAILGVDVKDEALTQAYLKKQIATFGLDHFRTKEIYRYLDDRGLEVQL